MISFAPIWAVTLRHMRMWRRDPNYLLMLFYWPLLDILVWGFLGSWIQQQSQAAEFHNYEIIALLGVLLWQIIGRGCNGMILAFNEELWTNNIVNLFSLPLRISEWIVGVLVLTFIMISLVSLLCILIIYFLYDVSLWYLLKVFFTFAPPLFIAGIWTGFTSLQIVASLGKRSAELAFVILWMLLPFSGAYYPTTVLPLWAQKVSGLLPMSYLFEGMRMQLMYQQDPTPYLIKGYILSIVYALVAVVMFVYCFNRSKRNGLARLAD